MLVVILYSCKTPLRIFDKKTAHEEYGEKINNLGLRQTALGTTWFEQATKALGQPVMVTLPYREAGYFAADKAGASGYRFVAKRGERLTISLVTNPAVSYLVFADLFLYENGVPKAAAAMDSTTHTLTYAVKETVDFVLRLQPELLKSGSYELDIQAGPSLAYPVNNPATKNRVISVWGVGRDGGARKHEGIDIGGDRNTPLVAVGEGQVTRVAENNLGGKVVFIRSAENNESWYYAHLDSQIAVPGQRVKAGDVIGLMGNTGNASTTVPHLHFGIYTNQGAVDPLPYVNPVTTSPKPVTAAIASLGKQFRTQRKATPVFLQPDKSGKETLAENILVQLVAASTNQYKVQLPGGETRFIAAIDLTGIEKPIRSITLATSRPLLDAPNSTAPQVQQLPAGSKVQLLGRYLQFQYIQVAEKVGWVSE